ncbi:MAG: hypothetical protein AAF483_00185 [Planctomycetota bacterium]
MRTGVLIHGCNLRAENWRHIVWGDPPVAMGRLPQGLLTAYCNDAEVIVLGSGASSKEYRYTNSEKTGQELLESEYTLEYLISHFDNLLNFKPWCEQVVEARDQHSWQQLKEDLLGRIVIDTISQNTVEELATAGKIFIEHGVNQVCLVSSPTHIVRVLRDANKVYQADYFFRQFMYAVNAVPCVTCYEGTSPSDVVVIEPPHRPDRHVLPTHRRIQRMLALQKLDPNDLLHFINDFDELLQHYEELYFNGHLQAPAFDIPSIQSQEANAPQILTEPEHDLQAPAQEPTAVPPIATVAPVSPVPANASEGNGILT